MFIVNGCDLSKAVLAIITICCGLFLLQFIRYDEAKDIIKTSQYHYVVSKIMSFGLSRAPNVWWNSCPFNCTCNSKLLDTAMRSSRITQVFTPVHPMSLLIFLCILAFQTITKTNIIVSIIFNFDKRRHRTPVRLRG